MFVQSVLLSQEQHVTRIRVVKGSRAGAARRTHIPCVGEVVMEGFSVASLNMHELSEEQNECLYLASAVGHLTAESDTVRSSA